MNTYEISVKNIYRILTMQDYPIYSEGVIREQDRKGLTLLKFCDRILLPEWKSGPAGKMIWRTDGSWNRYHSELCNRSLRFAYFADYSAEIMGRMNQQLFLQQMERFEEFLKEHNYNHSVLLKKTESFLENASTGDAYALSDTIDFLGSANSLYAKMPDVYLDSWTLTATLFHALAGSEMNSTGMTEFRKSGLYEPGILYEQYKNKREHKDTPIITNRMSEIMRSGVPQEYFFGREQELFELTDAFFAGSKVLVTGIGGIGKTELIRHLLAILIRRKQCGKAAEVQYTGGLAESFVRAFPEIKGKNAEERFHACLRTLTQTNGKPAVLMIDNAGYSEEEKDLWKELAELPCAVFATSRQPVIPGFQSFPIELLEDTPSMLLIRRHYGKILSDEEKKMLKEILRFDELRHPLTISMVGRAARSNGWSIAQILNSFKEGADAVAWPENGTEYKLAYIYRTLYRANTLDEREKSVIRLLSVIPYRSYPPGLIAEAAYGSSRIPGSETELFDRLYRSGWIKDSETGVSMHPLVADCVRGDGFSEWDFSELWSHADLTLDKFSAKPSFETADSGEISGEYARMLIHAVGLLKGDISERLFGLYLRAYQRLTVSMEEGTAQRKQLIEVSRKCPHMSEELSRQLNLVLKRSA